MINLALIILALHGGGVFGFRLRATNNPAICLELVNSNTNTALQYTSGGVTNNFNWNLADCDYSSHLGREGQRFSMVQGKLQIAGYGSNALQMGVYLDDNNGVLQLQDPQTAATGDWACHRSRLYIEVTSGVKASSKKFIEYPAGYDASNFEDFESDAMTILDTEVNTANKYENSFIADEEICPLNPGKNLQAQGPYQDKFKSIRNSNLQYTGKPGPNIIVIMVDDLGHHDVGVRNMESRTPNIDFLTQTGVRLSRHYGYKTGTQSRASFLFGREPAFMGYKKGTTFDYEMNSLAHVLKIANYKTTFLGKWSLGYAKRDDLPFARGFDYSFCSFGNSDLWEQAPPPGEDCTATSSLIDRPVGLWEDNMGSGSPAYGQNGTYTDDLVFAKANKYMQDHVESNSPDPFFMYISTKNVSPDPDVHQTYFDRMAHVRDPTRRRHLAQVAYVDDRIGELVSSTRQNGINANTLIVVLSDNGAPSNLGNNFPLRGGRDSDFDGGVRTVAFINGGHNYIKPHMRGVTRSGLMHISDWYPTFARLANVKGSNGLHDPVQQQYGTAAPSGYDMWDYIFGYKNADVNDLQQNTSPRTSLFLSPYPDGSDCPNGPQCSAPVTDVGFILDQRNNGGSLYKRVVGEFTVAQSTEYFFPNGTHPQMGTIDCKTGCLFDLIQDEKEEVDLCQTDAAQCALLKTESHRSLTKIAELKDVREELDHARACERATENGGYWGPYEGDYVP